MPYSYRPAFGPGPEYLGVLRTDTENDIGAEMLREDEAILELFTDDELYERFKGIGVTRTIIYKWRKKMEYPPLSVTDRLKQSLEIAEELELEAGRGQTFLPADKNGFLTSIYDHPGFASYIERFKEAVREHGFEHAYISYISGHACGCMGCQNGEPFCPCMMRVKTAEKFGKIVCIDDELISEMGVSE